MEGFLHLLNNYTWLCSNWNLFFGRKWPLSIQYVAMLELLLIKIDKLWSLLLDLLFLLFWPMNTVFFLLYAPYIQVNLETSRSSVYCYLTLLHMFQFSFLVTFLVYSYILQNLTLRKFILLCNLFPVLQKKIFFFSKFLLM